MNPGALRHWVMFQALAEPQLDSDDGLVTETWEDAYGVRFPVEIQPLSGRELVAAQAVQSKVSTRIRSRSITGLEAAMRVVHGSTVYNIEAVVPDPLSGREWVTLLCSSGVNDG